MMPTIPTKIAAKLAVWANACATKNHHRWQEFYLNTHVLHHHGIITIVTTCVNHMPPP